MKKNYIMPTTAIIKITVQHIIANSPFKLTNGEVTEGELQEGEAQGAALGRGIGFWDEDE
jgi:hypothetical protein